MIVSKSTSKKNIAYAISVQCQKGKRTNITSYSVLLLTKVFLIKYLYEILSWDSSNTNKTIFMSISNI